MKLVVGLGNPGAKYNFTRHNFGFLALDFYFKVNNLEWEKHEKFNAIWKKQGNVVFIKPQSFYNDTGIVVQDFARFYKVDPEDILAICDDFCLEFGRLRYRASGSDGGNNGLKSIAQHLSTTDFPRLRIGTGNDELRKKIGDTDFVLGKFTAEEKAKLPEILKKLNEILAKDYS